MSTLPTRVGPYQVVRELGRGGMGVVYEVSHPQNSERLALKLIHTENPEALARFKREMELLGRVQHAGLVRIHVLGQATQGPYLVTELVEGDDLQMLVFRGGQLDAEDAARIMRDLAMAVSALHDAGILHRDLKPQNVILRKDGQPVLLDFGLARAADVDRLTRTGAVMGTPNFMPPEMANGMSPTELDGRVDVYGLGATLYFLLAGKRPFSGSSNYEIIRKVVTKEPEWPSRSELGEAAPLWDVCREAMAKDREDRTPSALAMAEALGAYLDGRAVAKPAGRRGPLLAGAAIGLLLLALGALAAWQASSKGVGGGVPDHRHSEPTLPPAVSVTSPENDQVVFDSGLTVEGSLEERPAGRVWVRVGTTKVRVQPGVPFKVRVRLERGANVIPVRAVDPDGAVGPETLVRVTWVNAPPWYREMPEEVRAPVPLPRGLRFGAGNGEYVNQRDSSVLVWVPPGTFTMGPTTHKRGPSIIEDPAHQVTLTRGVFMGKYEVTWKQFQRYCDETGSALPQRVLEVGEDHPVHNLKWRQARAYTAWADLRLPTEAEWEWAARGPKGLLYPWGNEANDARLCSGAATTVAVYELSEGASPFGCLHMAGNVAEWTNDVYAYYTEEPLVDPTGALRGRGWVVRNGGYSAPSEYCKTTARWAVSTCRSDIGFRVALSPN